MKILRDVIKGLCLMVVAYGVGVPFAMHAAVSPASIITRPGVATSPVKYYFDLSSSLAVGVNHAVKVTVSASNSERTAARFEKVQLFGQGGEALGINVASKTDALSATPYGFVFQNFGVPSADLTKVAGVELTFLDLGGENPTGRVTVQSVAVSLDRNVGEACIIADPFVIKNPPISVNSIQTARKLISVGGSGTTGAGSGVNCGSSPECLRKNAATFAEVPDAGEAWLNPSYAVAQDSQYATSLLTTSGGPTNRLQVTNFGFDIPLGATINGIKAEVDIYGNPGALFTHVVRILQSGSPVGINRGGFSSEYAVPSTNTQTYMAFGGPADKWGAEEEWTPSIINDSGFGFNFGVMQAFPFVDTAVYTNHMRVTVYYTSGGGSIYDALNVLMRSFFKKIQSTL